MNNSIKAAFNNVHAEEELKSSTKEFLSNAINADIEKENKRFVIASKKLLPAMAGLVLVILVSLGIYSYSAPVCAISLDVNPSIEIKINRFDDVVSVKSYNDEGEKVIKSVNIKNMDCKKALDVLMSCEAMSEYLEKENYIAVTVMGKTEEESKKIEETVSKCKYINNENVECLSHDKAEVEAAHEAGLSFGKYQAFLELKKLDPNVSEDDMKNLTMCEIKEKIEKLSGKEYVCYGEANGNTNGNTNGNANGNGNGHHGKGNKNCK